MKPVYKNKAKDLRAQAREKLRELRQERLSKRAAAQHDAKAKAAALPPKSDPQAMSIGTETDTATSMPPPDAQGALFSEHRASVTAHAGQGNDDTTELITPRPEAPLADPYQAAKELWSNPDDSSPIRETPEPAHHEEPTPSAASSDVQDPSSQDPEPELAPSDLYTLPGAGEGLVWMLNKCDIQSKSDLAVADPRLLTEKLGVIGQIINVQTWIDCARE
jgi:hypothetical protein